jgi:hypothetical protein
MKLIEDEKVIMPKNESEGKSLKAAGDRSQKGSKGSKSSQKGVITKEKAEGDEKGEEKPSEEQKISSFWTEIRTIPKSTDDKWIIPYDVDKNLYDYEKTEIPKQIANVLDREEFDRMMRQINTHPKIISSSTQPHRKLIGVAVAAVGIFIAELYSDVIPQEALLAIVCLGFLLVILILNYIEEQKDSFGEVKRREINSILRQYECFTEKEVMIDFDVSDFGSYVTVTRLQNTQKLSHVLENDSKAPLEANSQPAMNTKNPSSKKNSNEGVVSELIGPNKQTTAAGYSDGKPSQDAGHARDNEIMTKAESPWKSIDDQLKQTDENDVMPKQQSPVPPPISYIDNSSFGQPGGFYQKAGADRGHTEHIHNPVSELDVGDINLPSKEL